MNKELIQYYIGKYCFIPIVPFIFIITILSSPLLIGTYNVYFHPIKMKCISIKDKNITNDNIDSSDVLLASILGVLIIIALFFILLFFIAFPLIALIITLLVIIPFLIKTICNCKRFYDNNKDRIETLNEIHKL